MKDDETLEKLNTSGRERLITNQETEEDAVVNLSLRPTSLEEFVGQKDVVSNLKVAISAAKSRGEPLEQDDPSRVDGWVVSRVL